MHKNRPGKKGRTPGAKTRKPPASTNQEPATNDTSHQPDPHLESLPPSLQREMNELLKNEVRIIRALEKEEMQQLFISNPAAALEKMKITVPPALKRRLKPDADTQSLLQPAQFRLANGQVITPKVKIRFTRE